MKKAVAPLPGDVAAPGGESGLRHLDFNANLSPEEIAASRAAFRNLDWGGGQRIQVLPPVLWSCCFCNTSNGSRDAGPASVLFPGG